MTAPSPEATERHALARHVGRRLMACLALAVAMAAAAPGHAAVPNEDAVPAYAEEQTILQVEKGTPEPGLLSAQSGRHDFDRHYIVPFGNQSESSVILQRGGNTWRVLRNGPLATISGVLLVATLLAIFAFYRLVGPARLDHPETGRRIQRFSAWDRLVHWSTAITFLVLAVTGLIILFGKKVLLPLVGHDIFSWLAVISKYAHNIVGPLFIFCSVVMFFNWLRDNFFNRTDWNWIKKGGGLVTHQHVPAGYFNAGEKLWFWGGVAFLGLIMSVSGLVLDFVSFGQTRYLLQIANYLHLAGATFYIVASMGHIYIGTWGTPGAYEAMRHGTVDEEWAREHHGLWYEQVKDLPSGSIQPPRPPDAPAGQRI